MTSRLIAAAFVLTCLAACAESDTADVVVAGTGSSGGNPSTVAFQLVTDDAPAESRWTGAVISAGRVSLWRGDATGECQLSDDSMGLGAFVDLVRNDVTEFDLAGLCGIAFRPATDRPLLAVAGTVRGTPVELELFLERGVDLLFDDAPLGPDRFGTPGDVVVALEVGALLRNLDLVRAIREREPDGVLRLSDHDDELGAQLVENVIAAITLFRDPTPGDGRVTRAERAPENRVGGARIP